MTFMDLEPAALRMAGLVRVVPADVLGAPTPCAAYTVGDLLDHIAGLVVSFTAAARKDSLGGNGPGPSGDVSPRGDDDWRERVPHDLTSLVEAWREPTARTGMTCAASHPPPVLCCWTLETTGGAAQNRAGARTVTGWRRRSRRGTSRWASPAR